MIIAKGNKVTFTGKEEKVLKREAKKLGLPIQTLFSGMMWEMVMREARKGVFLEKTKKS